MRDTFFKTLQEKASTNKDLYLLTGDLGFRLFDNFKNEFPERFFDAGIAESNMIGIAAGLALSGKSVYCYSIIPFLVMRAYEQIRVDVAYHNLDVRLVGAGGGVTYGMEGFTHFALEDFALMMSLPNMTVVVPADPVEAACVARISAEHRGPMYIRLGKTGDPVIHAQVPDFELGKAMIMREGKDIAVFAVGNMVGVAQEVADLLSTQNILTTVVNVHTLKPLDTETIMSVASAHDVVVSLEEHNMRGGLGSALGEVFLDSGYRGRFRRFGLSPDRLGMTIGHADYLREAHGLTAKRVYEVIMEEIFESRRRIGRHAV